MNIHLNGWVTGHEGHTSSPDLTDDCVHAASRAPGPATRIDRLSESVARIMHRQNYVSSD